MDPMSRPTAIIEMLILLAVAALIGWLLGRMTKAGYIGALRQDIADRRAEVDDCRASLAVTAPVGKAAPAVSNFATPAYAAPAVIPPAEAPASRAAATAIQSAADDLKLIEGVGPKIEELLNADGIRTFAKLAATNSQHIATLLDTAGPRFQIHNPETWPEQAALARDGKWDELKILQERLTGGRG